MRWWVLLGLAISLCACAGGTTPDASGDEDAEGGAGTGSTQGTGGSFSGSGGGSACDRWFLEPYGPGADGVLGTADDALLGQRTVDEVTAGNQIARETIFSGPGPDGQWDTPDDVILADSRSVAAEGNAIFFVSYDGAGPDGQWGNDDDAVTAASWIDRDGSKRPIDTRTFEGPGADGQWLSGDDLVYRRHTLAYGDGQSAPSLLDFEFVTPGPDGAWATSDDPVSIATRRFPDYGTFSTAPGPDGAWGTADDVLDGRYESKTNFQGFLQWSPIFRAGPDGAWFTPDDEIEALATSTCIAEARDLRLASGPGADQMWGTPDDLISAHLRMTGCNDPCGSAPPDSPLGPK